MTNDQISMKEKKRIIREDEWLRAQERQPTDGKPPAPMSYHSRTISEEAFPRGRYSQEMASDVIGSGAPKYPAAGVSFPEFLMARSIWATKLTNWKNAQVSPSKSLRPSRYSTLGCAPPPRSALVLLLLLRLSLLRLKSSAAALLRHAFGGAYEIEEEAKGYRSRCTGPWLW